MWIAIALVLALLWKRPAIVAAVLIADLSADGLAAGLKAAIGRDRPPLRYPDPAPLVDVPSSGSLPSGHAATSFACAVVLARAAPSLRWALFALAALIAWSRVYVGVHYPLDVVAGAALGAAVGLGATALPRLGAALRRSPRAS